MPSAFLGRSIFPRLLRYTGRLPVQLSSFGIFYLRKPVISNEKEKKVCTKVMQWN